MELYWITLVVQNIRVQAFSFRQSESSTKEIGSLKFLGYLIFKIRTKFRIIWFCIFRVFQSDPSIHTCEFVAALNRTTLNS